MQVLKFILVILGFLGAFVQQSRTIPTKLINNNNGRDSKLFEDPGLFLTLSSEAGTEGLDKWHDTEFEMNWYNFVHNTGDWVGLFNFDPSTSSQPPGPFEALVSFSLNETSAARGYFKTQIRFGRPEITSDNSPGSDNCLGFWIAYIKNDALAGVNCFRKYPRWMNDLKGIVGHKPLSNLMIPGTHDAGAIREYDGIDSENPVVRYSSTQEEQLYRQFIFGIRYIDTRVSYYPDTPEKFWINHGFVRFQPLVSLFNAVKRFVTETNEIIFMDFHEFPEGFSDISVHNLLVEFVQAEIGDFLVSENQVPKNPSANDIWAVERNVILTYQNGEVSNAHEFLWPYLNHAWGDKNTVEPLETYFKDEAFSEYGCRGIWWSAMAELTPTAVDIIVYPLRGLRGYAEMVNVPLTYWWQRTGWYSRSMIVSTDFFLGNNIIEMAITANKNNAVCPNNN